MQPALRPDDFSEQQRADLLLRVFDLRFVDVNTRIEYLYELG